MATIVKKSLGIINTSRTALLLCDIQEKFRPHIRFFENMVDNTSRVLKAAEVVDLPVIITEQYPKGLGHTVAELGHKESNASLYTKSSLSMLGADEVGNELNQKQIQSVILCGLETHACVYHTTLDLLKAGIEVHLIVDGVSSRSLIDKHFALARLRDSGAFLTTSEW